MSTASARTVWMRFAVRRLIAALQDRNEEDLRHEQRERHQRHPGLHEQHVAEDAEEDAAVQHRLRKAGADETADRVHLRRHDRDGDALVLGAGLAFGAGYRHQVRVEPQVLADRLDHRAAVDIEGELQAALCEDHDEVEPAKESDRLIGALLDGVVDDSPLQLERRKLEQEDADGKQREEDLGPASCPPGIAVEVPDLGEPTFAAIR